MLISSNSRTRIKRFNDVEDYKMFVDDILDHDELNTIEDVYEFCKRDPYYESLLKVEIYSLINRDKRLRKRFMEHSTKFKMFHKYDVVGDLESFIKDNKPSLMEGKNREVFYLIMKHYNDNFSISRKLDLPLDSVIKLRKEFDEQKEKMKTLKTSAREMLNSRCERIKDIANGNIKPKSLNEDHRKYYKYADSIIDWKLERIKEPDASNISFTFSEFMDTMFDNNDFEQPDTVKSIIVNRYHDINPFVINTRIHPDGKYLRYILRLSDTFIEETGRDKMVEMINDHYNTCEKNEIFGLFSLYATLYFADKHAVLEKLYPEFKMEYKRKRKI